MNGNESDLAAAIRAGELMGEATALFSLDEVWTGFLSTATEEQVGDQRDSLIGLADYLSSEIAAFADRARFLPEALAQIEDTRIAKALHDIAASDPRLADIEISDDEGAVASFREDVEWAVSFLNENVENEREALAAKQQRIANGEFTEGDISTHWRCAGHLVGLGLAVVLAVAAPPAGVTLIVIHTAHGAVELAALVEGCGTTLGRAWRWVRRR